MKIPTTLADTDDRGRLLDLSRSLFDSLTDLIDDVTRMTDDEVEPNDFDRRTHRISIAAMNCLGDMELLTPLLVELQSMRFPAGA